MPESIPIMPHLTKEQLEGVQTALTRRERADYDCYLLMRKMVDAGLFNLFTKVPWSFDLADLEEDIENALTRREKANDEFLSLISGRG